MLVLCAIITCETGYFVFARSQTVPLLSSTQIQNLTQDEERTYWRQEIAAIGGIRAWDAFKKVYGGTYAGSLAHIRAHIFGEVLFE